MADLGKPEKCRAMLANGSGASDGGFNWWRRCPGRVMLTNGGSRWEMENLVGGGVDEGRLMVANLGGGADGMFVG